MNYRKFILVLFSITVITYSCSSSLIEKRKYRSGYYWRGHGETTLIQKKKKEASSNHFPEKNDKIFQEHENNQPEPRNENIISSIINNNSTSKNNKTFEILQSKKLIRKNNVAPNSNVSVSHSNHKIKTKHLSNTKNGKGLLLLLGLFGIEFLMLILGKKYFVKISKWASNNKKTSRTILVLSQILLAGTAYAMGKVMNDLNLHLPQHANIALLSIGVSAAAFYPVKNRNYFRRKLFDIILISSGVGLIMNSANTSENINTIGQFQTEITAQHQTENLTETSVESKVLHMILLLIVTIGFGALSLAIGCGFICSGMDVLGNILIFGGPLVLIVFFIWATRKIIYKGNEKSTRNLMDFLYFLLVMLIFLVFLIL